MTRLYSVEEVASILGICKPYVFKAIKNGEIRAARLTKRKVVISEEALTEYISKKERRSEKQNAKGG